MVLPRSEYLSKVALNILSFKQVAGLRWCLRHELKCVPPLAIGRGWFPGWPGDWGSALLTALAKG
jgi:hypothetical protein